MSNAAQAQYGTPPPTMPHTGADLSGPFVFGVLLVMVGLILRAAIRVRSS